MHVVPCLGGNSGGPSRSVFALVHGLRENGVDAEIVTQNYANNPNIYEADWIKTLHVENVRTFEYNPSFRKYLVDEMIDSSCQIVHIHTIYSYPSHIATKLAMKKKLLYIVAPRGSLYQSAIEISSKWKKRIFNMLILKRQLNNASAVHVTCKEEMEAVRNLGITSPIAVIPNTLRLPEERPPIVRRKGKLRLTYLGRINPKKNIDGLLKAWHAAGMANRKDAELIVIGASHLEREKVYLERLRQLERDLSIENIVWTGPKDGKEKEHLLSSSTCLVLPSFSENFGMVVPEALQYGVPVIASKGTPWQILEEYRCGWWTDIDVNSLVACIRNLLNVTDDALYQMGERAQNLVWENFSTSAICNMQKELYEWIIEGGRKPDFVYLQSKVQ